MSVRKWLHVDGGTHKLLTQINASVLIIVASVNFINLINVGGSYFKWITDVFFIYSLGLFTIFAIRKRLYKWNALLYALLGIGTIFGNDIGNYSGAVFIVFSVYILNTQITNIILVTVVAICIVAKNVFFGFGITNTANLIIVYTFVFLIYFFTIRADQKRLESGNASLTINKDIYLVPHEKQLLNLMAQGKNYKEIAEIFEKSQNTITTWKSALFVKFQAESNEQLMFKFGLYSKLLVDNKVDDK